MSFRLYFFKTNNTNGRDEQRTKHIDVIDRDRITDKNFMRKSFFLISYESIRFYERNFRRKVNLSTDVYLFLLRREVVDSTMKRSLHSVLLATPIYSMQPIYDIHV